MSEISKYVISFGTFKDATKGEGWLMSKLPFKIEPPVEIQDGQVLQNGVKQVFPDRDTHLGRINRPADSPRFTHSTEDANYGTIEAPNWIGADTDVSEDHREASLDARESFMEFVPKAFNAALNPMGDIVLEFVFDGAKNQPPQTLDS